MKMMIIMEVKKDQNIIPAQSANFQMKSPFQHVVLSSNPLGIQKAVGSKQ
jgi:hypothetical protein